MLETNDLLQGRSSEQAAKELDSFLTSISLEESQLLLVTPPEMTLGAWVPS